MKLNFKQIFEGWKNDLFPSEHLKDLIRETQNTRGEICKNCPHNSTPGEINSFSRCKDCGCPLKKKTACLSCSCPLQKWMFVLTPEEDKQIDDKIKYKNDEEKL